MDDLVAPVVAVAQSEAVVDDVDRNLATLARLAARARDLGADLVVTPELFATGYAPDRAWRHDGAAVRDALASIARAERIALVASSVEAVAVGGDGEVHRISASLFDPDAGELVRFGKRHLFGEVERAWMTPADAYAPPFAWAGVTWGGGICYDVEFPEFARAQALAGADILLIPTAVPVAEGGADDLGDAWHYSASLTSTLQVPARALESGVAIAYANHCGPGFTGRSCIATPFGRLAVLLGDGEDVAVARIPLDAILRARAVNTYGPDLARG